MERYNKRQIENPRSRLANFQLAWTAKFFNDGNTIRSNFPREVDHEKTLYQHK